MSQNPLPAEDFFEESAVPPVEESAVPPAAGEGALGLQDRLQSAFALIESDEAPRPHTPDTSAIDVTRNLAAATLRQAQVFDSLQERVARLERGSDLTVIQENMRDLCDALVRITVEKEKDAADAENKFEAMAGQIKQLQDEIAAQRAEAAELKALVLAQSPDSPKGSVAQLGDDFDAAKSQIASLEETVSMLADGSIRSSEGLLALNNALEAAKTQIFSLRENSVYLTERLRIAEQVVEKFTRREKILAGLHARAARTLELGQ